MDIYEKALKSISTVKDTLFSGIDFVFDGISNIINWINEIKEFLISVCNILPTPFNTILPTFIMIVFAIIIYKLVRG